MTRAQQTAARLLAGLLPAVLATALAAIGAVVAAGIEPIGAVDLYEPHPGAAINVTVLVVGLVAVFAGVLAATALTGAIQGRRRTEAPVRESSVVNQVTPARRIASHGPGPAVRARARPRRTRRARPLGDHRRDGGRRRRGGRAGVPLEPRPADRLPRPLGDPVRRRDRRRHTGGPRRARSWTAPWSATSPSSRAPPSRSRAWPSTGTRSRRSRGTLDIGLEEGRPPAHARRDHPWAAGGPRPRRGDGRHRHRPAARRRGARAGRRRRRGGPHLQRRGARAQRSPHHRGSGGERDRRRPSAAQRWRSRPARTWASSPSCWPRGSRPTPRRCRWRSRTSRSSGGCRRASRPSSGRSPCSPLPTR